ncbi:NAD-specific glutamate dehydrogenase [compost metagenome]
MHLEFNGFAFFAAEQPLAIGVQCALHRFEQTLAINLVFTQLTRLLVGACVLERILEHAGDLAVGQAVGWLDLNAGLDPRPQFAGRDAEQAIGIDLEGHADLRGAGNHRRDAAQFEARQGAAVADQLAFALQHVDHHGRLAIFIGSEFLGTRHRNGGVARNHFLHQATHGLKAQGQRDDIEQQQLATFAAVASQGVGLDGSTDGHHLVRVDRGQRGAAEQTADSVTYAGYAGRTAHHHHGTDLFGLDAAVAHGAAAGLEAAGDQRLDHGFKGRAAQLALPGTVADADNVGIGQGFLGGAGGLQQLALGGRVQIGGQASLLDDPASNGMVEIIAAQGGIAAGGQHFEDTGRQAQDGNVEGTATQVIDGHNAFGVLVQAIGHGRCGRFVEQAQHIEAGQARSVLGGLALGVVEIGRHGDHRPHQIAAEGLLGALTQHLEDIGGHFHRAFRPLDGVDERHVRLTANKAVRQLFAQLLDVGQTTPHQALYRQHGVQWVAGSGIARSLPDFAAPFEVAHRRRQNDITLRIGQGLTTTAAQGGDQRIGGTQVDTHRQATLVRLRGLTGFGDLQ